ncbi:methyl jasmonate esterase 1-like [Aristolochia californica]|uniref:methyl jasmonate esterase 1-like n=1 Tax=Aristolochia californica TaxID=171875 RepID=UPI0035D573FB
MEGKKSCHFILVHGSCHGAWCWYKLIPLLKSAGHRVTALDLEASGIHPKRATDIRTLAQYANPLLEALASVNGDERLILVGHSYGGFSVALGMEKFTEKVAVAVFVAAFMPDYFSPVSCLTTKHRESFPTEALSDIQFTYDSGEENRPTSLLFGHKILSASLYQNCSPEDLTLATMLVRPTPTALEDVSEENLLTKERYGSVHRAYVICTDDKILKEDFQRWMVGNYPPKEIKVIEGSDHMPMFCKPEELCHCLLEIANTCS